MPYPDIIKTLQFMVLKVLITCQRATILVGIKMKIQSLGCHCNTSENSRHDTSTLRHPWPDDESVEILLFGALNV